MAESPVDRSYGIIPFSIDDNGAVRFLLVWELFGRGHWTFPKGHSINGETPRQTAERELQEETGLQPITVLPGGVLINEYSYYDTTRRQTVQRRVDYYLALVDSEQEIALQKEEVTDARWMTEQEALGATRFPEFRMVVRQAHAVILACKSLA